MQDGKRFSVTADEWTSIAGRRYLNVCLRSQPNEVTNLGPVRIVGSLISERTLEYITQHLASFGLIMSRDCVSCVTGRASVIIKFGRIAPT